jgi:hypothetical protein
MAKDFYRTWLWVTRRMSYKKKELLTHREHLSSPSGFFWWVKASIKDEYCSGYTCSPIKPLLSIFGIIPPPDMNCFTSTDYDFELRLCILTYFSECNFFAVSLFLNVYLFILICIHYNFTSIDFCTFHGQFYCE